MGTEQIDVLMTRLDRIEATLGEFVRQKLVKDYYTTAEAAELLSKAEFTVREWCRHGRILAEKRPCGRGRSREWIIPHAELQRYRNEGLRALPEYGSHGVMDR